MKKYYPMTEPYELELNLTYSLGGTNMFTYKPEKRGYYLHITVVKREQSCITRQLHGNLDGSNLKSGKILIKEVGRKSNKTYTNLVKSLDFDYISEKWLNHEYTKVFDYLTEPNNNTFKAA